MKEQRAQFDLQNPTPELLLLAYEQGVFPMSDPDTGQIEWFSPDPRGVLPLDKFHAPKNLLREVRRGKFDIRCDTAFEKVMRSCALPRRTEGSTWIDQRLIKAYVGLHEMGHAHSVEAWLEGQLVGGLYGVHIGGAFAGESMFSLPRKGGTNSSKVCLVHLVSWLKQRGFTLLDTQFWNEHLAQFGCVEIRRNTYLKKLADAIERDVMWGRFAARLDPC